MTKTIASRPSQSLSIGRRHNADVEASNLPSRPDADDNRYRVMCIHVHIFALGLAMVAVCLQSLFAFENSKHQNYYRLPRNLACVLLYFGVIIGNRTYNRVLYLPYLIANFLTVAYFIAAEALRHYALHIEASERPPHRVGAHLDAARRPFYIWLLIFAAILAIECGVYYVIYRDYKFVVDVRHAPPKSVKTIVHRATRGVVVSPRV